MTGKVVAHGIGVLLAAGILLMGGPPAVLSAQEPEPTVREVAAALLDLEALVAQDRTVAEGWPRNRSGWVSRVGAASTPMDFGRLLAELERTITRDAVHGDWRSRSAAWRARVRSASTWADLRTLYMELLGALNRQWDF